MPAAAPAVRRGVSWGTAAGLCLLTAALAIGLRPLTDNSFFTHLATGRLILDNGSVPSTDPFTFTAQGEPWVVQSWLASMLYATVEKLGGASGIRLLMGLTASILTLLAWRLTRPADGVVVRLALSGLFIGVGAEQWAGRPFMLGLIALACVALAAEGGLDPRWLIPIGWLWVNVHGSFPLGIAYLLVLLLGRRLDGEPAPHELSSLRWLIPGILAGAVGPIGPRILVFPVELLQRQDVLRHVIEWRAPTFESFSQRLFVLQLVLAIVLLVRRPSYRHALVIGVFGAAALLGSRNLAVASLLFLPAMAGAAPVVGSLRSSVRQRGAAVLAAVGVGGLVLVSAVRMGEAHYGLDRYPVRALGYMAEVDVDIAQHRTAAPEIVGNLLELLYGPGERVFYDDRFDMFPEEVSKDNRELVEAGAGVRTALDHNDIEVVVASRDGALAQRLTVDPVWRLMYTDPRWVVLCRRDADLDGDVGRC